MRVMKIYNRAKRNGFILILAICLLFPEISSAENLHKELLNISYKYKIQGRIALAVTTLRGAVEISESHETILQLASLLRMSGSFDEAVETYKKLLKLSPKPKVAATARAEIEAIKRTPAPFMDKLVRRVKATPEAKRAFKVGTKLARRKKYKKALKYLRAALIMDPSLPGTYRILGAIYGRLKDPRKERDFLYDYLRIRPDGKTADLIRRKLNKKKLLVSVDLDASFPCDVWVNGRPMNIRTPYRRLLLPPGKMLISFVNQQSHAISNKSVHLSVGEKSKVEFKFGLLTFKLNPWARVRCRGKDLGLWDKIGVPEGQYEISMVAYDQSREKDLLVLIKAGKELVVDKW